MNSGSHQKITVMHIVECAGGVDRYLKSFLKYLDREQFNTILVCSQLYKTEEFNFCTDIVEQIQMSHNLNLRQDRESIVALRKLIKCYSPDIVYTHSSKAGALGRLANIGIKSKCIYNPHGWAFNMQVGRKKQIFYKFAEKLMASFCDSIICISQSEKQSALKHKICKAEKLHVIFNGIDITAYEKRKTENPVTREHLHIEENAFVVGTVGRLCQQKSPDIFVRMAHEVIKKIPQAYFLMVGSGEMEEEVLTYAKQNGFADRLHITGWVDNPTDYIRLFDVATLLSRWEGFGLVIPEYMLCQKPVIATEVDAIPNIINDHDNGILIPMDDWQSAGKAVCELYDNDLLYQRLVAQGLKDVHEKYDVRRVAKEHEQIFLNLMK